MTHPSPAARRPQFEVGARHTASVEWVSDFWNGADWQGIGTLVALLGVIATLVLNLRSEKLTRVGQELTLKGQQQDREISENSALRSEAAARLTEDYTKRVVDALERIAREGLGVGSSPEPLRVSWSLEHHSGDMYRLTNTGNVTAGQVDVSAHESMGGLMELRGGPDLAPGEALTFMAAPSMATSDSTITVTWLQPDSAPDPLGRWRYPLPARPRR